MLRTEDNEFVKSFNRILSFCCNRFIILMLPFREKRRFLISVPLSGNTSSGQAFPAVLSSDPSLCCLSQRVKSVHKGRKGKNKELNKCLKRRLCDTLQKKKKDPQYLKEKEKKRFSSPYFGWRKFP